MKTNAELDKWAAEKLDEAAQLTNENYVITLPDKKIVDFTLSDARCREIVRECLAINTLSAIDSANDVFVYFCLNLHRDITTDEYSSIEAAEIACIQAIKDAEGSDGK